MAILEYDNKKRVHPMNWIGVRVAYLGSEKVYKSRHFNFRDKYTGKMKTKKQQDLIRKEAEKLELKWKKEGKAFRELTHRHIYFSIYLYRKNKTGRCYPTIRVGCRHHIDKIRYTKSLDVGRKRTFREAWKECANFLINNARFSKQKIIQLRKDIPSFEEFNKKRLAYNKLHSDYKISRKQLIEIY